jgi:uncharacterized protein YbaP (TraB family)
MMRWFWALPLALIAAAGVYYALNRPEPVHPALWRVDGPGGQSGYLFGTIHALPRPVAWRSDAVEAALRASDGLVVEIADLGNDAATAKAFEALAHTPALPPLDARVAPQDRARLAAALARVGRKASDFGDTETWAAALMLARGDAGDPGNGVDRALLAQSGLPVVGLEDAGLQLGLFDRLPEAAQRRLLADALADGDPAALSAAWARGDVARITRETQGGMLADPVLREALYTGRNRRWAEAIVAALRGGHHPFVAVGAAHVAGPDSLGAMLAARGYHLSRVQ